MERNGEYGVFTVSWANTLERRAISESEVRRGDFIVRVGGNGSHMA
jgi:hypothetical protein